MRPGTRIIVNKAYKDRDMVQGQNLPVVRISATVLNPELNGQNYVSYSTFIVEEEYYKRFPSSLDSLVGQELVLNQDQEWEA